jgi:hypothetical protein
MNYFASIRLPFAEMTATASWSGNEERDSSLTLRQASVQSRLPLGMSVDFGTAFIGRLVTKTDVHGFRFALRFVSLAIPEGAESGESLDAQSFMFGNSRAMIGTEDGDALGARQRWLKLSEIPYPIGYLKDGLEIVIDYIPAMTDFDFHFIVAFNSVASKNSAEWFAVDVPHRELMHLPATSIHLRPC